MGPKWRVEAVGLETMEQLHPDLVDEPEDGGLVLHRELEETADVPLGDDERVAFGERITVEHGDRFNRLPPDPFLRQGAERTPRSSGSHQEHEATDLRRWAAGNSPGCDRPGRFRSNLDTRDNGSSRGNSPVRASLSKP